MLLIYFLKAFNFALANKFRLLKGLSGERQPPGQRQDQCEEEGYRWSSRIAIVGQNDLLIVLLKSLTIIGEALWENRFKNYL